MANPLVERLKTLENTPKFRGATREQQVGVREKFVGRFLEEDLKFQSLPGQQKDTIRDKFLNRPFPGPPITASRAAEVAIQSVSGLPDAVLGSIPAVGGPLILARRVARAAGDGDFFGPSEPATTDELLQLDPAVAQVFGTIARLRLGLEKGTFSLAGLAPPIQRLLKSRFATQEDLVRAIEQAGGISEVRAAVTGLVGEIVGAGGPIIAGAKAVSRAKSGIDALKKVGITEGGANLGLRVAGGATVAFGEGVGALRNEPPDSPPLTDVPVIGPVFEKVSEVAGPSDPDTGGTTFRQELVTGSFAAIFGVPAAFLIPGRAKPNAAPPVVDGTKPTVGATKEMQKPLADKVAKNEKFTPEEGQDAVNKFLNDTDMSEGDRQAVVSSLDVADDLAADPVAQAAAAKTARENIGRAETEVDIMSDSQGTLIFESPDGKFREPLKFVLSTNPEFRDMPANRAVWKDRHLIIAAEAAMRKIDQGWKPVGWMGRDRLAMEKLALAIRVRLGKGGPDIPPTDAQLQGQPPAGGKPAPASKLPTNITKQLSRVQHPSAVGKRGAGTIRHIATESDAARVVSTLRNRGFVANEWKTDGQSGTFHVVWNIETPAAFALAEKLAKRSQTDPTRVDPDGSKGGLDAQEQSAVKANETNTEAASKILKSPKPKAKAKKPKVTTAKPDEVELPAAALKDLGQKAKTKNLRVNQAANVIEIADSANVPLARVEYGKGKIIPNATAARIKANAVMDGINSGKLKLPLLRAQSIIARTIDDAIEEAHARGVDDSVDRLTAASDITKNLDMSAKGARNELNAIRGALIDGSDEVGTMIRSDEDFDFITATLGDMEPLHFNDLKDVIATINDPVAVRHPLVSSREVPPQKPKLTQRAQRAIELLDQGQYASDVQLLKQSIADLDKMVSEGTAAKVVRDTAKRLSDPTLPKSENPLQGSKIVAKVRNIRGTKDKYIEVHDVTLKETQKFPYDGRGVGDAINYILSPVRRLTCKLCGLGLRAMQVGENRIGVMDDLAGTMRIFSSWKAVTAWVRHLGNDSRAGMDVEFPADLPVEVLGKWEQTNYGNSRGTLGSPIEMAPAIPKDISQLRRLQGMLDPIKSWFQSIENKFPNLPVFSQIWEPIEAGALASRQWILPKYKELAQISRGIGDDQAQGMQVMWMLGRNKNAVAQIKEWYRMSEQDVAKGEAFRQKIIDYGKDHGLDMDDFMQNQLPKITRNRGLIDQAFPDEIPIESLFFRSAFREDEISARHVDIRDTSLRLTRMMAKETFVRPAIDHAEAMIEGGIGNIKGLEGPIRQYIDAQVGIPPESRIALQDTIRQIWMGGVKAVQENVVKQIGTTKMDQAMSRHLERVKTQELIGPWVDFMLANVYGALMAWRPGVVIRNMPQSAMTILPRVGLEAWLLGLRDALRQGGFDAPRRAGAVDDVLPLAFSEELSERAATSRFGKSKVGKLFAWTQTFTETGLVPFTAVDRFHRATAYHAMKHLIEASTKAAPDVWARSKSLGGQARSGPEVKRLADVSEAIGIDMFGPIVTKQADAMLAAGDIDGLLSYLGRNLAEDTQWVYRKGNQAGLGRGTTGKVFFNFSTWPTWFGRYAVNLTTRGTRRNRMKAIATFAAVNEGLFLAGREVFGVDASHWLYWHPLNYAGGTNFEAGVAFVQAEFLETLNNRESFQQRRTRRVLETWHERQVPGWGAFKDAQRFFGANSPKEGFQKASGFPEAGERSLSVGERALSLLNINVGRARPGAALRRVPRQPPQSRFEIPPLP